MLCGICTVQIQPRKLVLDNADETAFTRQHELKKNKALTPMRPMALGVVAMPPAAPFPRGARWPCLYLRRIPMRYAGLFLMVTLVSDTAAWYSFKAARAWWDKEKRKRDSRNHDNNGNISNTSTTNSSNYSNIHNTSIITTNTTSSLSWKPRLGTRPKTPGPGRTNNRTY